MQLRKERFFWCSLSIPCRWLDRGPGGLLGWQISSITGAARVSYCKKDSTDQKISYFDIAKIKGPSDSSATV